MTGHAASQIKISDMWNAITSGFLIVSEVSEIDMVYTEHPEGLKISFNRIDLESVISHLMANSIESLKKKNMGQKTIHFDVSYLRDELQIKFSDNGHGIEFQNRDEIFNPFVTTNKTSDDVAYGHGFGLSITKEILQRHGGTISVGSPDHSNEGAVFTIKIPASSARRVI